MISRRRDAGDQPAAADRDDDRVEFRNVIEQFQRYPARSGEGTLALERMNGISALMNDNLVVSGE